MLVRGSTGCDSILAGTLGDFRFTYLMNAFLGAAVLLGIAQWTVAYIALNWLGISSALYTEFVEESLEWKKEYARFAVQCLVAGATFKRLDQDSSGSLDRPEIYSYLTEMLNGILDSRTIALLADFLMGYGVQGASGSVQTREVSARSPRALK